MAVHLGRDVSADASPAEALAAVAGWSVAIELADLDPPPTDIEEVLAGNIFHRHVLLGPLSPSLPADLPSPCPATGRSSRRPPTPFELTGELGSILASAASTLASCGASLSAGDVVITGSVIPPLDVSGGGAWHVVRPRPRRNSGHHRRYVDGR